MPGSLRAAELFSQSQKPLASLGGTPSPCIVNPHLLQQHVIWFLLLSKDSLSGYASVHFILTLLQPAIWSRILTSISRSDQTH